MAEVKIAADSGGGSVGLVGPASTTGNAAIQLKLPVADGSANQHLKTDGSGNLGWTAGGKILQIVQATSQTQSEITSDTDFFSATITPSATSSNVLVNGLIYMGVGQNPNGGIKLRRASTAINVAAAQFGSSVDCFWTMDDYGPGSSAYALATPVLFYDTGISTTSATTYTFSTSSVTSIMFNRTSYAAAQGYMTSILQLWEIGA